MKYRSAVLLTPLAYSIHLMEEGPRFIVWAQRFPTWFSPHITQAVFYTTNAVYMACLLVLVALCVRLDHVTAGLTIIIFLLSNALFHIIFTVTTGIYSPGVITSLLIYLPLGCVALYSAQRECLLSSTRLVSASALGGVVANIPLRVLQQWL